VLDLLSKPRLKRAADARSVRWAARCNQKPHEEGCACALSEGAFFTRDSRMKFRVFVSLITVLAGTIFCAPQPTLAPQIATNTPVAVSIPTDTPPTIEPTIEPTTPKCPEPPPITSESNDRPRLESKVGESTRLDAEQYFNLNPTEFGFQWQQVFSNKDQLDYITQHAVLLLDTTKATALFSPEEPGNYRFELIATDKTGLSHTYELDVFVTDESKRRLDVEGIIFADLFGDMGGPEFNIAPRDSECLARALDHAMSAPLRVGAGWVGFVSAAWYRQVTPTPVIGTVLGLPDDQTNYHSLTDETYFAALVSAAKQRGLKVAQTESLAIGLGLPQDQIDALEAMKQNPQWWNEWFDQWEAWVVPRAARAEKYGVDMYVLYLYPEFRPDIYPQYDERWREIIAEVRRVYTGQVAINIIVTDDKLTFIDDLDALLITAFSDLYLYIAESEPARVKDIKNPTMQELVDLSKRIFDGAREQFGGKIPVYYVLTINSTDGQQYSEDPNKRGEVDFQEQALYYEAFFKAIEDEPWITGVFTERWDWFDQFRRPGDSSWAQYFDETSGGSPRSKPAEEVVKLWFGIY